MNKILGKSINYLFEPLLSSFDGSVEKEPRKLDTRPIATSEIELWKDYKRKPGIQYNIFTMKSLVHLIS